VLRHDPLNWKKDVAYRGLSKNIKFIRIGSSIKKHQKVIAYQTRLALNLWAYNG